MHYVIKVLFFAGVISCHSARVEDIYWNRQATWDGVHSAFNRNIRGTIALLLFFVHLLNENYHPIIRD